MPETAFPTQVDLVRAANTLEIRWSDGVFSLYTGERLRWACPCAECRGEAGQTGRLDRVQKLPPRDLQLDQVGLIGQYALMITFASGHGSGIYTFDHLRSLAGRVSSDPQ